MLNTTTICSSHWLSSGAELKNLSLISNNSSWRVDELSPFKNEELRLNNIFSLPKITQQESC